MNDYAVLKRVDPDEAREKLMAIEGSQVAEMVLPITFRPAIELAIYSHDQLRSVAGMSALAHLSFDQTAVEAVARMHAIKVTPQVARDLAVLQAEGLRILRDAA